MTSGDAIDDIDAALADAFGAPEVVALADPRKRRAREKRMGLSPDDGRRKRATGRTKQFNCKMRPDLHRQLVQASRDVRQVDHRDVRGSVRRLPAHEGGAPWLS